MGARAAITVLRSRDDVERQWRSARHAVAGDCDVRFADAPGDRGTEIHVDTGGRVDRAKAMDDLRRFKQIVETGVIARSDAVPEGEAVERKLKQRPAQPLEADELEKAGAS